jgi:membrane peptidoglycan carboxypeptidase
VSNAIRKYYDAAGAARETPGNVYFHVNTACLKKKQAYFLASLVQIPQEIRPFLTPAHTTYLRNNGFMT